MYLCAQNHDLKRGGTFETAKAGTFHSVTAGTSIPLFTLKGIEGSKKYALIAYKQGYLNSYLICPNSRNAYIFAAYKNFMIMNKFLIDYCKSRLTNPNYKLLTSKFKRDYLEDKYGRVLFKTVIEE